MSRLDCKWREKESEQKETASRKTTAIAKEKQAMTRAKEGEKRLEAECSTRQIGKGERRRRTLASNASVCQVWVSRIKKKWMLQVKKKRNFLQ